MLSRRPIQFAIKKGSRTRKTNNKRNKTNDMSYRKLISGGIAVCFVLMVWVQVSVIRNISKSSSSKPTTTGAAALLQRDPRDARKKRVKRMRTKKDIATNNDKQQNPKDNNGTTTLLYQTAPDLSVFPPWIRDYVVWHQKMRKEFPGMELFDNPKAPKLLVRTCLGICGGLHDRIGQLPWDLYLAQRTGRVLLLAWQRPRSLENFLVPSGPLDWTMPLAAKFGFDDMHHVRNFTQLFDGYPEDHPEEEFWRSDLDKAIERATTGAFKDIKLLRHRILGHLGEGVLEDRLQKEEGKPLDYAIHAPPLFGNIFWLFFRPAPAIDSQVRAIMSEIHLVPQQFSAVHCRVRHPKAHASDTTVLGKNPKYPADKTGLPWEGGTRQFALDTAAKALQCNLDVNEKQGEDTSRNPVYFLSDSNDLVRHVAIELQDEKFVTANRTQIDKALHQVVISSSAAGTGQRKMIVARDVTEETAHLDRQKGRPPEAYFSTFIDLMITIHAKCVIYGIGYYAAFAAKISGTPCAYLYEQESWGAQAPKRAHICPNHVLRTD